ncbi:MAG: antibiotic biosynthesis monooxygenase [Flavobacteriales bacterium]
MVTRIVKMTFKSENVDLFENIFEKYHSKIRSAEGCLSLKLLRGVDNPNVFFTYSTWQDPSFLDVYRKSETFGIVWPQTKALFAEPAEAWTTEEKYDL